MKRILLVEPDYKNKYPPLGLMKLSTYHKLLGDDVKYVKGTYKSMQTEKWDRVYISTLFTFYWKKTIETILFYKNSAPEIIIGGVTASVLPEKIERETGIKPHVGLLNQPDQFGDGNSYIIDELIPDYDILDSINYEYPAADSYIAYSTRGCVRKCEFCAVPTIEPNFNPYVNLSNQIHEIKSKFGEKRNLLLLDNNILGSKHLERIIDEICELGFYKGATYRPENSFMFYANRLFKNGDKDLIAVSKLRETIDDSFSRIVSRKSPNKEYVDFLTRERALSVQNIHLPENYLKRTDDDFIDLVRLYYRYLGEIVEKYRNKATRQRYVDFNQGIDARLLSEKKMKLLAKTNIRPMRIAFDHIEDKDIYIEKIRLAAKHDVIHLSNYILYNYIDSPEELYERLKINIDLNEELGIRIFSFPMKYIPVENTDRSYVGKSWNNRYLRSIQLILNAVHGSVMPGKDYFEAAFGKNIDEFKKILLMPEYYILNRVKSLQGGDIEEWWKDYIELQRESPEEFENVFEKIKANDLKNLREQNFTGKTRKLLEHYLLHCA